MTKKSSQQSELRIIGGTNRRLKITFSTQTGCRPTPDRIRETLFNWLSPIIHGAHCLDMFAGSGALGFEALSRGASHVVMVEKDSQVTQTLKQNAQNLEMDNVEVVHADVLKTPLKINKPFDIVFIDPPFRQNLIEPSCQYLLDKGLVSSKSLVYIESEKEMGHESVPEQWEMLKSKVAGQVQYALFKVGENATENGSKP